MSSRTEPPVTAPAAYAPPDSVTETFAATRRDGRWWSGIAARLFVTVYIIYGLHFATNVVRETYLALSLGERASIRVDEYLGLHPDLFEIPGRGSYINNNPGASMLGAVPYAIARPAVDALFRAAPQLVAPKPAAAYDDPRPNRTRFMNEARERGLDVKLGLAAAIMHAGLMAPLGALAAVLVFGFFRSRTGDERLAVGAALLYAFATPIFFRSAFLNQNAVLAHATLGAFLLLAGTGARGATGLLRDGRLFLAGLLLGVGIVSDYSGVPIAVAFGVWTLVQGWRAGGVAGALRGGAVLTAGALGPLLVLLAYQWAAFGHPLFPAQRYMPATRYSVEGWNGFTVPTLDLLWRNLFDLRYGLFAFAPLLAAGLAAPFVRRGPEGPTRAELGLILGVFAALWLFNSANAFANLQWNTGVRYMVPAGALLFFAAFPVLRRMPPLAAGLLVLLTVVTSWSTAMARESVSLSVTRIFTRGFELPWLTVLEKTAGSYAPFLEDGTSPLPLFLFTAALLWLLWRGTTLARPTGRTS